MKNKTFKFEIVVVLIVAAFLIGVLLIKPIIGVADNGDFERIMNTTGLRYITSDYNERYFNFVNREYITTYPFVNGVGYFSSQVILVLLAKLISSTILFNKEVFDIRFLAAIYCFLFLLSIYIIAKYNKRSIATINFISIILMLLIFTDLGYISYFNSLYGEALSYTSLLLTVAISVYLSKTKEPHILALFGFYVSVFFLASAKIQNIPIGIVFALFSLLFLRLRRDKKWKKMIVTCVTTIFILSAASYFLIPSVFRVCNKYQSVFYGVLKNSQSPQADLEELGLKSEYASLSGTNYFMKEYPINIKDARFESEINSKISPLKVALFYFKHPKRYVQKLEITANNAFNLIQGFGNYEKVYSEKPKKEVHYFRMWNDFKVNFLPHSLTFLLLFFGTYTVILTKQYLKAGEVNEKIYFGTFLIIMIIGCIQFVVPIICDGEADLSKHLFLFNVCFDIMFIYMSVWFIEWMFKAFKGRSWRRV